MDITAFAEEGSPFSAYLPYWAGTENARIVLRIKYHASGLETKSALSCHTSPKSPLGVFFGQDPRPQNKLAGDFFSSGHDISQYIYRHSEAMADNL